MPGEKLADFDLPSPEIPRVAVKEAVLPFARFPGVDTILGPEMRSTGEVMGLDVTFDRAFLKSQIAAGTQLPDKGVAFISVRDGDKAAILAPARALIESGLSIVATGGTATYLAEHGVPVERVNKVFEGRPHIIDRMMNGDIALVFNTTEGSQSLKDSYAIRATALSMKTPYYTTAAGAAAAARAIRNLAEGALDVAPLQDYAKTA
jgi:carbamoyl-phosphate synthase large subunit